MAKDDVGGIKGLRFRHVYMGIGSLLVILILMLTDPDNAIVAKLPFGAGTTASLIILLTSFLYVTVLHLSRKALIDYIDLQEFFKKALLTPEGAGKALIGVGLMMIAIAIVILAAVK